ncbi:MULTISPECIES: PEP-CTERM sorting domain-containing protein [unclassified Microcoleus]|uniref:PEP-CTERM sorting domain-containing protein n=1 Tax=unclassified Microcoleus TaxID=2642155 RepID=UPI002FD446C7
MGTSTFMQKLSIATFSAAAIALGTGEAATAGLNFISTQSGQVGVINTSTGAFTEVARGSFMADIALSNDNRLFGSDFYNLVGINPALGTFSNIGSFGAVINGLGFAMDNELYGTGYSGFYRVNTLTGAARLIKNIANFSSSGDIAYDLTKKRFLATSDGDSLWSIPLDGSATKIGNIGFDKVYGLLFDRGTLYGYTGGKQIAINTATGAGTFSKNVAGVNGWIGGAASAAVPEPATVLGSLLGMGILGSARSRYKRQRP